jgi:hypothetical protein
VTFHLPPNPILPVWIRWQTRRATRATARAQHRLDRRQRKAADRLRARGRRMQTRRRLWAAFQPVALAVCAFVTFVAAGASTGLLFDSSTRAVGVALIVGGLCATAGLLVLEWRIGGD